MVKISDEQIDFILKDIEKRGVVTEDVKYNILDHVCCIIENDLPKGEDFYKFYKDTIARFYRKELKEIEQETQDLLTYKYYYAMKRTLKTSGIISALFILIGSVLKVLHLPGAGISFVTGLTLFSLIFIPLNVVLKFRDNEKTSQKWIMLLGLGTTAMACIGILFKIMHWPYAMILFDSAFIIFVCAFIPVYAFSSFKNPEKRFNGIIHSIFMIAGCGMLFAVLNQSQSHHVMESVESMDHYQVHNVNQFQTNNDALYADVSSQDENANKIKEITSKMLSKIRGVRANLISKSNQISFEEALQMSASDVKNPNDVEVVKDHFTNNPGEYSYQDFENAIKEYNVAISGMNQKHVLRPIDLEKLQMERTLVSVVLHELVDIEIQVLANENSYLCLSKGLLVQK